MSTYKAHAPRHICIQFCRGNTDPFEAYCSAQIEKAHAAGFDAFEAYVFGDVQYSSTIDPEKDNAEQQRRTAAIDRACDSIEEMIRSGRIHELAKENSRG